MNEDQKQTFLELPLPEQLLAILDGQTFIRSEIEALKKRQSDFEEDVRLYRRLREMNEVNTERIITAVIDAIRRENATS